MIIAALRPALISKLLYNCSALSSNKIFRYSMAASGKSQRLQNKVAWVTASTAGIGYAIAERLGQEGAHVIISSRKQSNVDASVKKLRDSGITVTGMVCHAAKKDDRTAVINKIANSHGGLDIFVANAGMNPFFGEILSVSEEQWDKIFEVNVKATFFTIKEIVPLMEKKGGGSIVLVSSIGGYVPFELIAPYAVSKTALLGLTKALAPQCAAKNIRVNCIAPGVIKTHFSESLWKADNETGTFRNSIPLKRYGEPEDCAGAVAFLASDDASYITSETIVIAGGQPSHL